MIAIWFDTIFEGLKNCIRSCIVKASDYIQFYTIICQSYAYLQILLIVIEHRRHPFLSTATLAFMSFNSSSAELQNDIKHLETSIGHSAIS